MLDGRKPATLMPVFGSAFIRELTDSKEHPALTIGKDTWSRHEVATELGVVHTKACSILSGICKRLGVHSTADLFNRTSPYTFADEPAGVTTLYVMFAAFRDKGLNAERWYWKGEKESIVTWMRMKARELEAERRTKADARRRNRNVHTFPKRRSA